MNIHSLKFKQVAAALFLVLGATLQAAPATAAEAAATQVLDRVFTYNAGAVLNMAFGNAERPPDFTNLGLGGAAISTCTLTATDGLYCLDGKILRKWTNPLVPATNSNVLNCADNALALDTSAGCTAMTVDRNGTIWLAGKKRLPSNWPTRPSWIPEATWIALQTWFKPYSLVKLVPKTGVCPDASWSTVTGGAYCAKEFYSGRFIITNLSIVDGEAAANFVPVPGGAAQGGVLAIEDLRNVVFFPAAQAAQPITISGGWNTGLRFGEVLQDVTLLQLPAVIAGGAKQNFVLATTTAGRVMSKNTASGGLPTQVFNIPTERRPASAKCSNATPIYGVRSSATAAMVFVTDRAYCQVAALVPNGSNFTALVNLQDSGTDFTLSTRDSSGTFPVIGLTVAPGTGIDLRNCNLNCAIVNDENGNPAATLSGIQLAEGSAFTATVFQVQDIPDCRYAYKADFPPAKRVVCASTPGVVINPDGTIATINPTTGVSTPNFPSAAQVLNVTPLLPPDVTVAFDSSGVPPNGLPKLLISRHYRGQARTHFLFEALFVVPAPNVHYTGVFGGEYNVPALEGLPASLGCVIPSPVDPTLPHTVPANLLAWDVTTAVSETYIGVGGRYIDSLANVGCGSVKGEYSRMSLLPYDLEIAPDTYGRTIESETPTLTTNNDAVFARVIDSLVDDLGFVFHELACKPVDNPSAAAPLPASVCSSDSAASDHLYWIRAKYDHCLAGAFRSLEDDNALGIYSERGYCLAFLDRLTMFQDSLPANTAPQDIANRLGELKSRIDILRHIQTTRMIPSIPDSGFQSEGDDD